MITHLSLKNFKGWKDTKSVDLAPITVFFGSNSSGKTSLIQSLLLLKQSAASSARSRVLHTGDEKSLIDLGTPSDLIYGHSRENILEIGIGWTLPSELELQGTSTSQLAFDVEIGLAEDGQPFVQSFNYLFDEQQVGMTKRPSDDKYDFWMEKIKIKRRPGRVWPLPAPSRFYGFPDELTNYFQDAHWTADLSLALEQELARIHYVGPLREYPKRSYLWAGMRPENVGSRGELSVPALLAARMEGRKIGRMRKQRARYHSLERVIADWLLQAGMIESFRVEEIAKGRKDYEVRVRRTASSPEVLITDVGVGVSQILPVVVQCYYAQPNETVIFEQPEIHLHPRVQAEMADVIIDAMLTGNVQFIIESHSEHFLRRLQRRIAEAELVTNEQVALYKCDVDQGHSVVERLEVDEYGNITNWPKDFFGDEMGDLAAMALAGINRRRKR
jgi:predicted ATPase